MVIQFKNRKHELAELNDILNSEKFEMLILYGRRRIGKTELVLNATKNKKRIYHLATGENNLERFYDTCLNFDSRAGNLKKDWNVLFDFLKENVDVIIIDEFQNMIKEDKNILNIFQLIVDTTLKTSKLKLFLLGSSVSIMTSKVLNYASPLYGRKTGSIDLKQVSFFDLPLFFQGTSMDKLLEIYGFAGGIPFYLNKIDNEFWVWLKDELKQQRTFLKDEVDFLVRYEFSDVGTYKLILEALAKGNTKVGEIKDSINVKRTDISPYLTNLIEVGFIERRIPVTENIKSREGRYFISDNFIKFWFRYIYPNLSSIAEGIFDTNVIKRDYSTYLGFVFEEICRQFLIKNPPFTFTKIGNWWHKDKEIDLVAFNEEEKKVMFVECKWQENVDAKKILNELKEKVKDVRWNNEKRKETYCIIAKSFKNKAKIEECLLFDLKDLERENK